MQRQEAVTGAAGDGCDTALWYLPGLYGQPPVYGHQRRGLPLDHEEMGRRMS